MLITASVMHMTLPHRLQCAPSGTHCAKVLFACPGAALQHPCWYLYGMQKKGYETTLPLAEYCRTFLQRLPMPLGFPVE